MLVPLVVFAVIINMLYKLKMDQFDFKFEVARHDRSLYMHTRIKERDDQILYLTEIVHPWTIMVVIIWKF